jgi:uncharacterized phage protein (TIGR02218 family)
MDYLSRTVFDFRPNWSGDVDLGELDDFSYDSQSGAIAVPWKPTSKPKRTISLQFLLDGLDEISRMRAFIADREGRRKGFWLPIWVTDYGLTQNESSGVATISVEAIGIETKLQIGTQFRHIALITADKMEFYRIESVVTAEDVETITLDRGLDSDLDKRTVCCGLIFARLADDQVEYRYLSGKTAQVKLNFIELPIETEGTEHTGSKPIFLYRITRGATAWLFTNYGAQVTAGDIEWVPADIEHGSIQQDMEFSSDPVSLTYCSDATDNPFFDLLSSSLIETTDVEIFETDAEDLTVDLDVPLFKARFGNVRWEGKGVYQVQLSSLLRIGETQVPRVQIQRTCNHRLFDAGCGLAAGSFDTAGTVTEVSSSPAYVEAAEFGAEATAQSDANWFALGKVVIGTETRLCVGQSGDRLYLNAPFKSAAVSDLVTAYPGCNKRAATCQDKFDNLANFLGWPYLPNTNPQFEALKTPQPQGGKK